MVWDGVGLAPFSMVWNWRVSRAGPMLFYWPKLLYPYYTSTIFPFLFFLSIGWYCEAWVFGGIGCISLSLSLALPTSFNNNNNNKFSVKLVRHLGEGIVGGIEKYIENMQRVNLFRLLF